MRASTAERYRSGFARWTGFCAQLGRAPLGDIRADPSIGKTVELFVADQHDKVAPSTLAGLLSAVRFEHVAAGLPDPTDRASNAAARTTLDGAARARATPPRKKKALSLSMLRGMVQRAQGTQRASAADAVIVATFGGLRGGEVGPVRGRGFDPVAHLARRDVRVDELGRLVVHVARSKRNDHGADVTIGRARRGEDICPGAAVARALRAAPVQQPEAPLFQNPDGTCVSKADMAALITEAAMRAGQDGRQVSAHSPRVTLVNLMLAAGFGWDQIKAHGRWASDAAQEYVRDAGSARAYRAPARPPDSNDVAGTLLDLRPA